MMNQFFGRVKHAGPKDLVSPLAPGSGLRCLAPGEGKPALPPGIIKLTDVNITRINWINSSWKSPGKGISSRIFVTVLSSAFA